MQPLVIGTTLHCAKLRLGKEASSLQGAGAALQSGLPTSAFINDIKARAYTRGHFVPWSDFILTPPALPVAFFESLSANALRL